MKISLNWLKEYIPFDFSAEELADRLTMVGLEVEEIHRNEPSFRGVVVGKIVRVEKHPKADKLKVCRVDVGEEVLSVVCGAPNVKEGRRVPVAKVGAVLDGHISVKSASIKGVRSRGMICSERELGLSDDHSGILVLDGNTYAVGDAFLGNSADDAVLDINVTPNRPDCMSILGIAREMGVILGRKVLRPEVKVKETETTSEEWVSVDILDADACPRYSARVVRDVSIGPSPRWMSKRLESVGIRSINNVVDVTNYILMETGHPLHAFDYEFIQGQKIVVRKAESGETFITLDGEEHKLTPEDLLICDGERGVALAGVMGGLNSEVSDHTQHILLESAYFDPMTVRKTAKRLGISTEASQRFERGADPNNTIYAVNRAAQLLSEVAGGSAARGIVDCHPKPVRPWEIFLRSSRIATVLGTEIPRKDVIAKLKALDLEVEDKDPIRVTVPTFRPDLQKEIDLIEEVVRHYGYDKIEPKLHSDVPLTSIQNEEDALLEKLRDILVGLGFLETVSHTFVSKEHVFISSQERKAVVVQNPLNPETSYLRTSLIPNLLDTIRWNANRSTGNLRLFEIGRTFLAKRKSLPDEQFFIAGALSGFLRSKPFWGEKDVCVDVFHLKGVVESIFDGLHIKNFSFDGEQNPFLQPETSLRIQCAGKKNGLLGEVRKELLDVWDISNRVFVFEIDVSALKRTMTSRTKYSPIPKFPSIKRDLAVVVDERVFVGSLMECIQCTGGKTLKSVELFDIYRGKQIPSGKKSVAFSLTFLSSTRTLKEEEVDPIVSSVLEALSASFSARLRS